MDMVSRNDRNEIFAVGHVPLPLVEAGKWKNKCQRRAAVSTSGSVMTARQRGADSTADCRTTGRSIRAGVPFVYFGVEDHPDYHEPSDTREDRINPAFFRGAVDIILEAIRTFDARLP